MAKIIALAKKLDITIKRSDQMNFEKVSEDLKNRIINFRAHDEFSFGDALEWQKNERIDRVLPFNK